jgi:hydrogenase maturation factor
LATDELFRVVSSMSAAAKEAGALLVTGDTKVVNHGKGGTRVVDVLFGEQLPRIC